MSEKLMWSAAVFMSMILTVKMLAEFNFAYDWGSKKEECIYFLGVIFFGILFVFSFASLIGEII